MPSASSAAGLVELIEPVAFTSKQAGGHVAGYFFGEALGFLRAFLGQQIQAGEFFFLRSQLFDHTLHGRGHEGGGIFGVGFGTGKIAS